jgi:hypothetical protein
MSLPLFLFFGFSKRFLKSGSLNDPVSISIPVPISIPAHIMKKRRYAASSLISGGIGNPRLVAIKRIKLNSD